ncbi:hypothetical protein Tco_0644283, partial [Tanacetum coccineum]
MMIQRDNWRAVKARSLELDVRIGPYYGVKVAAAPTHSAFIGTACSGSKPTYSDQQRIVPSVSQTSGRSNNVMECVLHSFVAENEQDQDMIYEDFDQVDQLEMEGDDLKCKMAMLSFEELTRQKVYGMMAGLHADSADASDAAAEFAMMGISPKAGEMHAVPPPITGTYMPSPYQSDIEETQRSQCILWDSSLKTLTKRHPPAVDIKTLPESDVEDPNSTAGSPSFSCSENVKSPRIICNKSGMNNRNVCKNNSVRVKKCFVCGSKLHLIKDCDFYNCVDSVPCKSKAASVPAGSGNLSASVTADGSDPVASRNRPAVNSAGRPKPTERVGHPAGWSKRPAPVSAGRPVSAGWLNPAARPYFRPSSVYFNNMYWPN